MKLLAKRWTALMLALLMVVSMAACTPKEEATPSPDVSEVAGEDAIFTPGSYTATGRGNGGDIEVTVTFDEVSITDIVVGEHKETEGIADLPIERIPAAVIEGQTLNVDVVSGATLTSDGLIEAITAAVVMAGGDPAAMMGSSNGDSAAEDVEETADVIVVGGGGAGLAAAVSAHQNGASVVVVEKMPKLGGNTIISGAAYNTYDPDRQNLMDASGSPEGNITALIEAEPQNDAHAALQAKLEEEYEEYKAAGEDVLFDSPTMHALQTYSGGDYAGNLTLIEKLTYNSLDALHWLEDLGMGFTDYVFTVLGGLWPRAHRPEKPLGTGYIETLANYCEDNGITIMLETTADALIVDGGKVVGVEATGASGNKVTLHADKSVVLATGGFGMNVEMREEYNKAWATLDATIKSTNHPGATGDGIIMAQAIGAGVVGMEHIQLLPMGDPETGSLSGNIEQGVENRFFVNKNGDRFVAEDARRDIMTNALYEQPDAFMWVILDKHSYESGDVKNNFNETIDQLVEEGRAFKADTIEDLAEQIGVPAENLQKAVDSFNAGVENGTDEFNRTLFTDKIDTPPYYAGARVPTVHHTMGGLLIDVDNAVIDADGNVIPGLFAAGEVTGGIHGTNRLGGNALADIMVNGRAAGINAAK